MRHVRRWIDDAVLARGDALPSARTIADELEVNRATVTAALAVLERQGVLSSTSTGRRVVKSTARSAGGMLGQAIAVVAANSGRPKSEHRETGWSDHVTLGSLQEIDRLKFHALLLNPELLCAETIEHLIDGAPCGVIIPEGLNAEESLQWARRLEEAGIRFVVYGDHPGFGVYDRAASDQELGGYLLTRHLIETGRRRIVNVWPSMAHTYWLDARHEGYLRAMREAGLEPRPVIYHPPYVEKWWPDFEAISRYAAGYLVECLTGPAAADAIMAVSDGEMYPIAAAIRLFGKVPNGDVAVTGYDNYWADCRERQFERVAPAATIEKENPLLGAELVRLLAQRSAGELPAAPQRRIIEPRLVVPEVKQ